MKKLGKSTKKGFTLVELIVVLVILAILAAMLVPALVGYIDRAKKEKEYQAASTVYAAVQALATETYGKGGTLGSTDKDKSTFTREEVTKLTGVTVTDIQYCPKAGTTKIDEYTIYYVAIKFKADDDCIVVAKWFPLDMKLYGTDTYMDIDDCYWYGSLDLTQCGTYYITSE